VTGRLVARGRAALRQRVRNRFAGRVVVRDVAGARLAMPWSHRLPDYVQAFPGYGRNLVDLAEQRHGEAPLTVLDVGANIGDSALQILARVDARILCVDGDPHWVPFLYRNTGAEPRVTVVPALVVADAHAGPVTAVRQAAGTTSFVPGAGEAAAGQLTAEQLRDAHPDFADLRLLKSDTDGFDARIVPLLARAWSASAPVLFFEYDPELTRQGGDPRPERVWDELAELGYRHAAAWTNTGEPLGSGTLAELAAAAAVLPEPAERGCPYWDVALAVDGDDVAAAAFARLAPGPLPRGRG
jgi:FkbM family methyltransferase